MVVSWGCTIPAGAMSSTEIIAKSAGTESPRLRSPRTAPMATLSLAQKMAVGGFSSFRREATPRSPPSSVWRVSPTSSRRKGSPFSASSSR